MTQKEKAKELVQKMKLATDEFGYIKLNKEKHRQCALIAIDEIIKELYPTDIIRCEYWQEVKQEINKL